MECAECQRNELVSSVRDLGSWVTEAYRLPFCDSEGKIHDHRIHIVTTRFVCSKGHKWKQADRRKCWCGWPD